MNAIVPNFVRIKDVFQIGVSLVSLPSFSGEVKVIVETHVRIIPTVPTKVMFQDCPSYKIIV